MNKNKESLLPKKNYIVHSLERGLEILELLAERPDEWALFEIAQTLGFSSANTHKLLRALKANDFVTQNPENSKYRISLKLFWLGSSLIRGFDIISESRPIMKNLANKTNTVACLTVRTGDDSLCIEHAEGSTHVPIIFLRRGVRLPLYIGAAALSLLAFLPQKERDRILSAGPLKPWTPATLTDVDEINANLQQIREQKYCICRNGVTMGISAIAMPIHDRSNLVIGSISIAGLSQDFEEEYIQEKITFLKTAASELSTGLVRLIDGSECSSIRRKYVQNRCRRAWNHGF